MQSFGKQFFPVFVLSSFALYHSLYGIGSLMSPVFLLIKSLLETFYKHFSLSLFGPWDSWGLLQLGIWPDNQLDCQA